MAVILPFKPRQHKESIDRSPNTTFEQMCERSFRETNAFKEFVESRKSGFLSFKDMVDRYLWPPIDPNCNTFLYMELNNTTEDDDNDDAA
jgi:hypothetical protein